MYTPPMYRLIADTMLFLCPLRMLYLARNSTYALPGLALVWEKERGGEWGVLLRGVVTLSGVFVHESSLPLALRFCEGMGEAD